MLLRIAVALAFFTALTFVSIKSFSNPDSAMVGMAIIVCGWVSLQIIRDGLVAVLYLVLGSAAEKQDDKNSHKNDEDPYL